MERKESIKDLSVSQSGLLIVMSHLIFCDVTIDILLIVMSQLLFFWLIVMSQLTLCDMWCVMSQLIFIWLIVMSQFSALVVCCGKFVFFKRIRRLHSMVKFLLKYFKLFSMVKYVIKYNLLLLFFLQSKTSFMVLRDLSWFWEIFQGSERSIKVLEDLSQF